MSLLMQALKKAERAKQASLHEEELEKPSEAYDQVLELAPADTVPPPSRAPAGAPPQAPGGLSLEPLNGAPAAPPYQPPPAAATPEPPRVEPPHTEAPRAGAPRAGAPRATAAKPRAAGASRSSIPPRSAVSIDPATLRLAVLLGLLLLVVAAMGYWYWRATSSPGAGASLPGVPMPLTDAPGTVTGAGPVVILPATSGPAQAAQEEETAVLREEEAPAATLAQQQAMIQSAVQAAVQAQLAQMPPAAPPTLPPVMAPPASQIQIMRNDAALQVAPGVQQGYQALSTGQLAPARQQYEAVLAQDPANRDALLGLATVALREQQGAQAAALYVRLLELNPDDGVALAGLVGLRQGDLVQSEARLKAILERTPDSGPVLFALGNVYAKQRRWNEAQQQFFRAYSAVPDNPDYAFNLAVGLDRLNQPRLAASYYQRALSLAQAAPAGFDRAGAQTRLQELGGAGNGAPSDIVITRQQ